MSPPTVGEARCHSLMRLLERHLRRLENFHEVQERSDYLLYAKNSVITSVLSTVLAWPATSLPQVEPTSAALTNARSRRIERAWQHERGLGADRRERERQRAELECSLHQ